MGVRPWAVCLHVANDCQISPCGFQFSTGTPHLVIPSNPLKNSRSRGVRSGANITAMGRLWLMR